jgi:hypothetical protein
MSKTHDQSPLVDAIADPGSPLTEVSGDLVLAALCVGQFRAPCQIESDRLVVRADEVLMQALHALGLGLAPATAEVFTPAPLFAPDTAAPGRTTRHVHTHVSHVADDEDVPEDLAHPGSNA